MSKFYASHGLRFCLFALSLLAFSAANAQLTETPPVTSPCLVDSLVLNIGYDHSIDGPLPIGVQDSLWEVTDLTAPAAVYAPANPPYPSYTIAPLLNGGAGWVVPTDANWISFLDTNRYMSDGDPTHLYDMTLTRRFKLCQADSVIFNVNIAYDNHLTFLKVDTVTYGSVYANGYATLSNYTFGVILDTGWHTMSISIDNFNAPGVPFENAHGLVLVGTARSATGANSIISSTCATNTCTVPPPNSISQISAGKNTLYQNVPNPFTGNTSIEYYIDASVRSASVMIISLQGQVLANYPIQQRGAGNLTINTDNLPSGVYIYSLTADGAQVDHKRMIHSK